VKLTGYWGGGVNRERPKTIIASAMQKGKWESAAKKNIIGGKGLDGASQNLIHREEKNFFDEAKGKKNPSRKNTQPRKNL